MTTFSSLGVTTVAFPTFDPPPVSISSMYLTPFPIPLHIPAPTPAPASPACVTLTSSPSITISSIPAALKLAFKSRGAQPT